MEEFRPGRFLKREHELHQTAVGRILWRNVRTGYSRPVPAGDVSGPYETSYHVTRGYTAEYSGQ